MAEAESSKSHLLFGLAGTRYAVATALVYEIIWLPELTPVPDAPRYITGVFNFGGKIVPVIDLSLWLGLTPPPYKLSDRVIVIVESGRWLGILVNEVYDVRTIFAESTEDLLPGFAEADEPVRILRSAAKLDENIVLLPDHHRLIRYAEPLQSLTEASLPPLSEIPLPGEAREIFRERARALVRQTEVSETAGLMQLAVIQLNGEPFGVKLKNVREFAKARNITSVPCCPDHVLGNMNLRGEVLTVVDIRGVLRMPLSKPGTETTIMVAESKGSSVGIAIDDVLDIVSLDPAQLTTVPVAAELVGTEYFGGTASYAKHVVTILDLEKVLASQELVVNEEV